MADPENNSLLGDILAASSGPSASANPLPAPRARTELEDLLRLSDEHWGVFLAVIAPDDLVVICKGIAPPWRNRVLASLDTASADWLRANLAALDEVAPALLAEARGRVMANTKKLLRDGDIVLPEPPGKTAATAAASKPKSTPAGVAATTQMPATVSTAATAASAATATDDGLDALFTDLLRLRNHSGVGALAPLAGDVPDPFLKTGLCLVAADLPANELERALDGALARQAESYLDQLARMRTRLLSLARGTGH